MADRVITENEVSRTATVWVAHYTQQHDYSSAEKYGKLAAVTRGAVNIFRPEKVRWEIQERMKHYQPDDYILLCGHVSINFFILIEALRKAEVVKTLIFGAKLNDYRVVLFKSSWLPQTFAGRSSA